ncbi:hypothetical protein ACFLTQ_01535 [Chloroflexota bacterium]
MTNKIPNPKNYIGLSRLVLQYADGFNQIIGKLKQGTISETDWDLMEDFVDIDSFQRVGMFLTDKVETSAWQEYKATISQFGVMASWEGALRRITEVPGLVFLELEERVTVGNTMDVYNTVTIYQFNKSNKLIKLDVYTALLSKQTKPA